MKKVYVKVFTCVYAGVLALTGCTYDDTQSPQPTSSTGLMGTESTRQAFTLPKPLIVSAPTFTEGMRTSHPLSLHGPCSLEAVRDVPQSTVRYLGPTYHVAGLAATSWRLHLENGLTVAWPQDTYVILRHVTPATNGTSVKMFAISKDSFMSLLQINPSLRATVTSLGLLSMTDTFYVTSYDCIP